MKLVIKNFNLISIQSWTYLSGREVATEVKIKVNTWTVHQDKKRGPCGEVAIVDEEAISGGWTVAQTKTLSATVHCKSHWNNKEKCQQI